MKDGKRKKYGKKYFKRKTVKPINRLFKSVNNYGIKPEAFPPRLVTRMVYSDNYQDGYTTINHNSTEKIFRLNSIYDPDYSGTGVTVNGWSALNTVYERYIVHGAKVEVTFSNPDVDGGVGYVSLIPLHSTAGKTLKDLTSTPTTYTSAINNTGSQKHKFKLYVKPWSQLGISKLEYKANSSLYSSAMGNNPTNSNYLRVGWVYGINNEPPSNNNVFVNVKITYYVTCYNRRFLPYTTY